MRLLAVSSLVMASLFVASSAVISHGFAQTAGAPTAAQSAQATALMKQGDALAAAGNYQQASQAYLNASKLFEALGQRAQQLDAVRNSLQMSEKQAEQLLNQLANRGAPGTAAPAGAATQAPLAPTRPVAAPLPLDKSAIVNKAANGEMAVADRAGRPIGAVKLSQHDTEIYSPSIAVAPNGTIHVAFVEAHAQTRQLAVYYRSSSDGGKTWSEAKNLSEVMPGYKVGNCKVAIDTAGRVYVIWHTGVGEGYYTDMDAHADPHNNIVFRVLEGGTWSANAIPVHPPFGVKDQNAATAAWFVSTDAAGKVHVVWNMFPDANRYPDTRQAGRPTAAMGASTVMEAVLDGAAPGAPRDVFMSKIQSVDANGKPYNGPANQYHTAASNRYDTLDGYIDATGQAHFITFGTTPDNRLAASTVNHLWLVENGKETPLFDLPSRSSLYRRFPPKLLVDAKGRQHIIAMYEGGEQPNVRDYLVGGNQEPTLVRAAKQVKGKLYGFQAYQGPGGHMIAIMQMNDTGNETDDELYLSTSDGGTWSAPVNVTNNSGREAFASHQTTSATYVATSSYWYPGPAAAAYDASGHLALVHISNERSAVASVAGSWTIAGGSTNTPRLLFLHF